MLREALELETGDAKIAGFAGKATDPWRAGAANF